MSSSAELQILLPDLGSAPLVAGLPPAVRTADRAAAELSPSRIVFCGPDPRFMTRWARQLSNLGGPAVSFANGAPASAELRPDQPVLIVSPDGFPDVAALGRFIANSAGSQSPTAWVWSGRTVAAYYPNAADLLAAGRTSAETARLALSSGAGARRLEAGWLEAADAVSALKAERALYARLPKDEDGYLARWDRKVSVALSRVLLKTSVTPNAITTASLLLGLLGAWGLASGAYAATLAGAALLWFCCILDGCDGEVARLKLLCSPSGAAYDLAADHVAHLATFVAIPIGVHRADPAASFYLPGLLLVSGFLACIVSVWWLVLRLPEKDRGPYALLIERIASRDYVYLILALAAVGKLSWFLWAAGIGSHLFWLALWQLSPKRPTA